MSHRFIKIRSAISENLCISVADSAIPSRMKSSLLCLLFIAATSSTLLTADLKTVDDFRAAAAKANAVLTIPNWDQKPDAVEASTKEAVAKANAALDQIDAKDLGQHTLKRT